MSHPPEFLSADDLNSVGLSGWISEVQFELEDPSAKNVGHGAALTEIPIEELTSLDDWVQADISEAPALERLGYSIAVLESRPGNLCVSGPPGLRLGTELCPGAEFHDNLLFLELRAIQSGIVVCQAEGFPTALVVKGVPKQARAALGVFSRPVSLPPTPKIACPALEWVDSDDDWLLEELELRLEGESPYEQVAAAGLHLRLRPLAADRFAAILEGAAPSEGRELAWARALSEEQRAGVDRLARAHAAMLEEDIHRLLEEDLLLEEASWWSRLADALCRRDELEGVLTILLTGSPADAPLLEAALGALDGWAASAVRALPEAPEPRVEHLARAAALEPEAWWVAPWLGLPQP